tara:strand:+ start:330 stop:869 length:540 start_codon:yes stop_codon:yes gene_type:complete
MQFILQYFNYNHSTADTLSRACESHIKSKEQELLVRRTHEDEQRVYLDKVQSQKKEQLSTLAVSERRVAKISEDMRQKLIHIRNAINIAISSQPIERDKAMYQTCVFMKDVDGDDFQTKLNRATDEIDAHKDTLARIQEQEKDASSTLERATEERTIIEKNIEDIRMIQSQLMEKVDAK